MQGSVASAVSNSVNTGYITQAEGLPGKRALPANPPFAEEGSPQSGYVIPIPEDWERALLQQRR
ncbi:hypothetical protein GCM10023188_41650 [Pontibacter saemangeumensis]|uniref:Uncharacterized protein n=1 Tax=Pontibacter saemangeumensis TaxID=1084525 RepID=A0ABP8M236_9BACT